MVVFRDRDLMRYFLVSVRVGVIVSSALSGVVFDTVTLTLSLLFWYIFLTLRLSVSILGILT